MNIIVLDYDPIKIIITDLYLRLEEIMLQIRGTMETLDLSQGINSKLVQTSFEICINLLICINEFESMILSHIEIVTDDFKLETS